MSFAKTGSRLEVQLQCTNVTSSTEIAVRVLTSEDGKEAVLVKYCAANSSLCTDHRLANSQEPSSLIQNAPVPAAVAADGTLGLRVFVDGGMIETFLDSRVAITSLVQLPAQTISNVTTAQNRGVAVEVRGAPACVASVWQLAL